MWKTIIEFFQEDNGRGSNTRLNSTAMIWCGCLILVASALGVSGAKLEANTIAAAALLLTTGAGQKLIQKGQETKNDAPPAE